jgi:hypothetical protein
MPTPTYDLIASSVLTFNAPDLSFTSISASYRDLVLVAEIVDAATFAAPNFRLNFNSDTGANYNMVNMAGNGSTATSSALTGQTSIILETVATIPENGRGVFIVNVLDYSATDKHKTILSRGNSATTGVNAIAARWANTAAISTIGISTNTGRFATGSTFYLYGIVS